MIVQYIIEPITPTDTKPLVQLLLTSFSSNQVEYEGISNTEFAEYLEYMCMQCCESGLGYIARCNTSHRILGGVLCCDLQDSFSAPEFKLNVDHDPMFAILRQLNLCHFNSWEINPNEYLQIKFVGVDSNYKGHGVAVELIKRVLLVGQEKGFSYVHAESAGNSSQYIFNQKLNFDIYGEVKYRDFVFNGTTPFTETEQHQSMQLMLKEL